MTIAKTLRLALAAALCALPQAGWTVFDPVNDDTDIFLANPTITSERPNVLIMLDNTANWNTAFLDEKSALVNVVNGLNDNFDVGLMFYNESGQPVNHGAYVRFAIRQMTATNKTALTTVVNALDIVGDKGNNNTISEMINEAYNYWAGIAAYTGYGQAKRDYAGNTANNPNAANLPGNAFTDVNSQTYVSPIQSACQKNFQIYISNGPANENSTTLADMQNKLAVLVGKNPPDTIPLNPNGQQGDWMDEYAKFMANSDCNATFDGVQTVSTYVIEVNPTTSGQGPAMTALMQSVASNGKGKYFAVQSGDGGASITNALNTIFQEVQAVNSVFASTTLPVSVNVRGTNLNQVYIGVFRPDANKSPKWLGNLKLYKLGVNTATGTLFLADATGAPAENTSTGFITGSATSFWTAASTYWAFRSSTQNGVGGSSDSPDGDLVEKGAAAQRLRLAYPTNQSTRPLYTCVNATHDGPCAVGTALSTMPFDNTQVTATDLGAYTSYNVSSLSSAGTTTATLVLPAAPNPVWAVGDQIVVAGATPSIYNGTFSLASANNLTFTYTYTLPSAPNASQAQATLTNHGLQSGDLVSITSLSAPLFNVSNGAITRIDANNFIYTPTTAPTGAAPASNVAATASKQLVSISGTASSNTATAVVPGLNVYNNGDTVTISGNTPAQPFFDANNVVTSGVTNDIVNNRTSFNYTTPTAITGGGTAVKVSATSHNISSAQSNVFIIGNSVLGYNTGPLTSVSTVDPNTFTFASTQTTSGTGGTVGVQITSFSHPTTGSGNGTNCGSQDVLTVTTNGNHNIVGPFPYTLTIAGGSGGFAVYNGSWVLNSSADVPSANTLKITQTSTQNNTSGNCNFDSGMNGAPTMTMVAGKPITRIDPIVAASSSPIYASKSITLNTITALTTASGTVTAGRTIDSNNTLRDQIIAWVRGADNLTSPNEDPATDTVPYGSDIRPSVHGDVLHSRPAVVNYNRYGDDNDIYAFYGSNDGIFHGLKGGIANHTTGPDTAINPGTERWGFIPREFFAKLQRLRNQSPSISGSIPRNYFADGSIGVYSQDAKGNGNSQSPLNCIPGSCGGADTVSGVIGDNVHPIYGDKIYLYMSMRRGGRLIYALDVTNPATPKLLWRHNETDTGWEQLGTTFSEAKIAKLSANIGNSNNPNNVVLIFGAGYERPVEDINPCLLSSSDLTQVTQVPIGSGTVTYTAGGSCTVTGATGSSTVVPRTRGRAILVVDAFDGTVIWQAGAAVTTSSTARAMKLNVPDMGCAIPSDTVVLDKNRDGLADRVYVGDTCGQVWRADITSSDMTQWTVTKIAAMSSSTSTDIANKRKFLFPPDLVFGTDANGNYTAVLIGSGDREHPFDTTVINRFYMIKDRDSTDPQTGAPNSSSVKIAGFATPPTGGVLTDADVFDATTTALVSGTDPLGLNGWKITLAAGEKVVSSATSVAGTTFFNTNQPSSTAGGGACGSNLGIAREYQVGFADASATADLNGVGGITIADRSTIHAGGGYLPSPVPVVVEIDGKKYQAVISGTSVQTPPGLTLEKRTRQYWYKQID